MIPGRASSTAETSNRIRASPEATTTCPRDPSGSLRNAGTSRSKSVEATEGWPFAGMGTNILPQWEYAGSRRESPPAWTIRIRRPLRIASASSKLAGPAPGRSRCKTQASEWSVLPPLPMRLPSSIRNYKTIANPGNFAGFLTLLNLMVVSLGLLIIRGRNDQIVPRSRHVRHERHALVRDQDYVLVNSCTTPAAPFSRARYWS